MENFLGKELILLMTKEILVSAEDEETRVAIVEEGVLTEYFLERPLQQRVVGNVYKGRVDNVLPGMEAAFVNIGLERNAFLYVDDVVEQQATDEDDVPEHVRNESIKDLLKVGQEIIVQVAKEAIGNKGARVTTNITLPGRFLVLMPTVDYVGVSRRIEEEEERERLRQLAEKIRPRNMGLIVRTVAQGKSERELAGDMRFLLKLWQKILHKGRSASAPGLLHRDLGLVSRVVRDFFTEDVDRLLVDSRHEYERIIDLLDYVSPGLEDRVHYYDRRESPLFDLYGLEAEIEKTLQRKVWLKIGGYLVIDQTEALTVIDVNTGKYVGTTTLENTVYKTNIEAAREIARQLRLRDIGGIIIVDFIDMDRFEHRAEVVRVLEEELKRDRTKAHVLGLTQLGLVEITRKKVRQGLDEVMQKQCPYCHGRGRVLSEETMAARIRREIKRILRNTSSEAVLIEVNPAVAALLIGAGGSNLKKLEKETGKSIYVKGANDCHIEGMNLRARGARAEVEKRALPVQTGDRIEIKVEEPHVNNTGDGIARLEGYVIDIEGGGKLVGEKVQVEVVKTFRTYARARIVL